VVNSQINLAMGIHCHYSSSSLDGKQNTSAAERENSNALIFLNSELVMSC